MKAIVVYESLWGNTAAVARAVAEGLGPGVPALPPDEAVGEALAGVDLIVAGSPVLALSLPTDRTREGIRKDPGPKAPRPADLSHPSLRSWLDALPAGSGRCAAFETRVRYSPRGATSAIAEKLEKAGYRRLAGDERFIVKGKYGPLRDGEVKRAREWGAQLAGDFAQAQGG
jgi:hypothetical protein